MNRLQLYELRSRAAMLARYPTIYREDRGPVSPETEGVLRFMEEQAGPLCEALTAELNRAEGAGHSAAVRCARCGQWRDFFQVRLYPPAPGRAGPEAVCAECQQNSSPGPIERCVCCDRCRWLVPEREARVVVHVGREAEQVCEACLADEREHEMARANAGVDAHREDDACERAAGREE